MRNPVGRVSRVAMPRTGGFYARDRVVSPAGSGYSRSISDAAKQAALGQGEAEEVRSIDWLRRKKVVQPYEYTFDGGALTVAASGTNTGVITFPKEANFTLEYIKATVDIAALGLLDVRSDDFTFEIHNQRKQNVLMNVPIHNLCATGSGTFPFVLPQPLFIQNSSTITIKVNNRRAQALSVNFTLGGKNYYLRDYENLVNVPNFVQLSAQEKAFFLASGKQFAETYLYGLDDGSVALAAGGASTGNVMSIRQSGPFEVFALTSQSDEAFDWQVRVPTGRNWSNQQISSGTSFGDGERPYILPEPLLLEPNTQLLWDFTNRDAGTANTVFICLVGRLWYDTPSQNLTMGPEFYYDRYRSL